MELPGAMSQSSSYYRYHVFFCRNQRENGEACCEDRGAEAMWAYAKQRIKDLGLDGVGGIRINKSGCMGRCEEGPVLVVYPQGVWYTYIDETDIEEIITRHLQNGEVIERLRLADS